MTDPRRGSVLTGTFLYLLLFFGSGVLGGQLARAMAPGSALAEFVSFLAFPAGFLFGVMAWAGAALPAALRSMVRRLRMTGVTPAAPAQQPIIVPGSFAFVPTCVLTAAAAGVVAGVLSRTQGFAGVLGLYLLIGAGFGTLCWRLARSGVLPFPRE
ncbi:MAG TPA: hypothetical protein VMK53_05245 [Gemmatimonadales bacterium]|nr:hypothetical protein [Gemmatimonadales bacterium]